MGSLIRDIIPTTVLGRFNDTVEIPAGKTLKVEWAPAGMEVFSDTVPAGKKWTARVYIHVTESDA